MGDDIEVGPGADAPAGRPNTTAPSYDDVISGSLQEALNDEWGGPGHMVMDWVLVANLIGPDGSRSSTVRYRDEEVDFVTALGLLQYGLTITKMDLMAGVGDE